MAKKNLENIVEQIAQASKQANLLKNLNDQFQDFIKVLDAFEKENLV